MSDCRFGKKVAFPTEAAARRGADLIRQAKGAAYDQLYPYRCPNETHWHLSSKRQGNVECPLCCHLVAAWWSADAKVWVTARHGACPPRQVADTGELPAMLVPDNTFVHLTNG